VPVPGVVIPSYPQHYPFPVTPTDEGVSSPDAVVGRRSRQSLAMRVARQQQQHAGYRMHTARARDEGGRRVVV